MITLRIMACVGLIFGLFLILRISLEDFTIGLFNGLISAPKGIREEILEQTKEKKKSFLKRELEETREILTNTGRLDAFPALCTASFLLFSGGAVVAAVLGNPFLIPVFAIGFMLMPFWYVKLTETHYKKVLAAELETALSIITTAYLRSEDVLTSVEENLPHLNPPIQNAFADFVTRVKMINPNMDEGLEELRGKISNDIFQEWVDAMKACQYDRSLKSTLAPIVEKLSDTRIVNAELEYMLKEPRKEFITMAVLVVANIPLMYFLNHAWYDTLMHTLPGQVMLAICGTVIFVSAAFVIRLTKPIEYRN